MVYHLDVQTRHLELGIDAALDQELAHRLQPRRAQMFFVQTTRNQLPGANRHHQRLQRHLDIQPQGVNDQLRQLGLGHGAELSPWKRPDRKSVV